MSDLAATGCCNNDCGCSERNNCGCNERNNGFSWIWIIILLSCCGGCGNDNDCGMGRGNGLFGGDDCGCLIIILLLCCCGGNGFC